MNKSAMKKSLEEIFNILEANGCEPEYANRDVYGFSRTIKFKTKYQFCWIEWWTNVSYVSLGDRYANKIPFFDLEISSTSPSNNKELRFRITDTFHGSFSITLEKLSWQEG